MKPELEKLCTEYIANRDAVKKAFRWDKGELFAVCANIFCANGQAADADRLKECLGVIRKNTGAFSTQQLRSLDGNTVLGWVIYIVLNLMVLLNYVVASRADFVGPTNRNSPIGGIDL